MKKATMAKVVVAALLVLLLLGTLGGGCARPASAPAATQAKTYNWKFLNGYPTGSPNMVTEQKWFADKVAELSGGRISIKFYGPGELGAVSEFVGMMKNGFGDLGMLYNPWFSDIWPLGEVISLPFMAKTYKQSSQLTRHMYETAPELKKYLNDYNVHPLWYLAGSSPAIQTTKPVQNVAGIKGLKFRTPGGVLNYMLKELGGVSISLGPGDAYQALQTGVIEGAFTALHIQEMYKYYEVAQNFIVLPYLISTPPSLYAIRQDLWLTLSKEDQEILTKTALQQEEISQKNMTEQDIAVLNRMKEKKANIVRLSKAEADQMMEQVSKKVVDAWLKDNPGGNDLVKRMTAWLASHPAD